MTIAAIQPVPLCATIHPGMGCYPRFLSGNEAKCGKMSQIVRPPDHSLPRPWEADKTGQIPDISLTNLDI